MDSLLLNLLNDNANTLTALATAAIAILTFFLAWENHKLRKAEAEPNVVAYITPHPDGSGGMSFVLSNIGQGPALNISFAFDYDEQDFKKHDILLLNDSQRTQTSVLPAGERISALFGISYKLADENGKGLLKPFTVKIKYSDINKKHRSNDQVIDVSQFAGLAGIFAKPANRDIADALQDIEKHMAELVRKNKQDR